MAKTPKTPKSADTSGKSSGTGSTPQDMEERLFPPRPDSTEGRALTEGTDAATEYAALLESICGATDDSQAVEQYDGSLGVTRAFVDAHQGAVGQLQWNNNLAAIYTQPGNVNNVRWATGAMISSDLFLTAGHNFDQTGNGWTRPRDNATGLTISPAEIATNMHVNFNFQNDPAGNPRPEQRFPVLELVEYRLGNLDFSIVRLGGNPGDIFGSDRISTTDAAVGQTIAIIGHPAGVPKRVEAGPVTDLHGSQIGYNDIDTLGGNSGSCILRATDGQIVGVHVLGGCSINDPSSDSSHNHGVRITSILQVSPTLQQLSTATTTILDTLNTPPAADLFQTRKPTDDIFTSPVQDQPTTRKFTDDPTTRKSTDDPITLKFADDPQTTKFADDLQTRPALDQIGTRKALDDVKSPALDKNFSDQKLPQSDVFNNRFNTRFNTRLAGPGAGGAQPFVMATPHHSAMAGQGEEGPEDLAETIMDLAEAIEERSAEMADLMQMFRQAMQAFLSGQR